MKTKNIFWSLLAALAIPGSGLFSSCENADADAIYNRVYIAEAASTPATKVTVEAEGAKLAVTVRMAQVLDQDVSVKLKIDTLILEAYNAANKTSFEALPAEYYDLESDVAIIKAGQVTANQSIINIRPFTTGGKNYALPIIISEVSSPLEMTNTSSKFIFMLDKPLVVKTPILSGDAASNGGVVAGPFKDGVAEKWGKNTLTWTLEGWVRMDGFKKNNQALFTSGSGDHEIYIRFGDTKKNPADRVNPFNYLQIKTLGSQTETEYIFIKNKWHHFALTYDGTNCIIYVNGKREAGFAPPSPKGGTVRFDGMTMIGSGATYFQNKCNLSQVRLWTVALTQTQIQNNMFYELDASNPDMMAYWKMDEGEGKELKDSTPNGHDAVASAGCFKGWTDYVRFDK